MEANMKSERETDDRGYYETDGPGLPIDRLECRICELEYGPCDCEAGRVS
jgi:hypothetical protein